MELFQTLIRPDREENSQRAEVCKAANFLQVGEFQFLQLAYREWHKDEMPEELTNSIFKSYMLHDEVPHWARHYGRRIISLYRRGELNDRDPAYHRYDRDYGKRVPQGMIRFIGAAAVLFLVIAGMLLIGHLATDGKGSSVLPPYFTPEEIRPAKTHLEGS